MYKLLMIPLMLVIWLAMYGSGMEQELAMKFYYKAKQAVNRGAHAAALQIDQVSLADGVFQLDVDRAKTEAKSYIYRNLNLDQSGNPTEASFVNERVEIVHFEVLDAELIYPYHYELEQYSFSTVFHSPAVIIVLNISYPGIFSNGNPVEWNIVGSAQLVPL